MSKAKLLVLSLKRERKMKKRKKRFHHSSIYCTVMDCGEQGDKDEAVAVSTTAHFTKYTAMQCTTIQCTVLQLGMGTENRY